MLEMLVSKISEFADAKTYKVEKWEGTQRAALIVDAEAVTSHFDDDEFDAKFAEWSKFAYFVGDLAETEAEFFDGFVLFEFSTFDVVIISDYCTS